MRTKTRNLSLILLATFAFVALLFGMLFTNKSTTAKAAEGDVELTYDNFTGTLNLFEYSATQYRIAYRMTLTSNVAFTDAAYSPNSATDTAGVTDYILINGVSLKAILADSSLKTTYAIPAAYGYGSWDEGGLSKGWTPVYLDMKNNSLQFEIDRRYVAPTDLVLTLKAGWRTTNGDTAYVINEDISYRIAPRGVEYYVTSQDTEKEIYDVVKESDYSVQAANVTFLSAEKRDDNNNYSVVWLKLPATFASTNYGNGTWTLDHFNYIKDYMVINGKPATWWNTATYSADYNYAGAPAAGMLYQLPVMGQVYSTNDNWVMAFSLNKDWMTAQGFTVETLTIGVRAGMPFITKDGNVEKLANDIYAQYRGDKFYEVREFAEGGEFTNKNAKSLNENQCLFELNAPADYNEVAWHMIDWPSNQDFQNYIYINDKSVADINKNTATTDWAWNGTFNNGALHYPVIVYISNATMQIYIHPSYMAILAEEQGSTGYNVDITVEIREGGTLYDATNKIVYSVPAFAKDDILKRAYTLTVLADGVTETTQQVTRGEKPSVSAADKAHYDFVKWVDEDGQDVDLETFVMPENDYTIRAVFEAITYTVTFKNGETVVDTVEYTVEDTEITEPEVPAAPEHYTGAWEAYELDGGDKTVNAVYTAVTYTVTFMNGEDVVDTVEYTVEDESITEPAVPERAHYTGEWEAYELDGGNKTVNATYTATVYTVTFKNGEIVVGTVEYTIENTEITAPAVPDAPEHYTGGTWEAYTLDGGNKTVNAVYTAIEYTVTFMADGEVVDTVTYTIEDTEITEPEVPEKSGYTGEWEAYELDGGDKTVNAVYTSTGKKKGCNGSITAVGGILAVITVLAAGCVVLTKKQHN